MDINNIEFREFLLSRIEATQDRTKSKRRTLDVGPALLWDRICEWMGHEK